MAKNAHRREQRQTSSQSRAHATAVALLVVLSVASFVGGQPLSARQLVGELVGRVSGEEPAALAGRIVRLRDAETGAVVAEKAAGEEGQFRFIDLAPGRYVVEVLGEDGEPVGSTVATVTTDGPAVVVEVALNIGAVAAASAAAATASTSGALFASVSQLVIATAATVGVAGVIAVRPESGSR